MGRGEKCEARGTASNSPLCLFFFFLFFSVRGLDRKKERALPIGWDFLFFFTYARERQRERKKEMASVSAANLSTKAKIDVVESIPAFSEEVISNKNPRNWNDLPEHLLLKIFECLTKENGDGRVWVSRAGRVCKAWRRASKDLLLGDTAASRPKRVQMITSEVHDNKTTLTTKGDLVEESVCHSASEVEACSKRQRLDSSALNFPAFSDASLKNPTVVDEGHLTEVGSLVSHLVERSEAQNHNPFNNINVNTNATHETMMNGGGSVGHPPMVTTHPQTQEKRKEVLRWKTTPLRTPTIRTRTRTILIRMTGRAALAFWEAFILIVS